MKIKIQCTKVFTKVEGGESCNTSIIVHSKHPYCQENIDMGHGQGKTIVTQWEHWLHVNLWLIEFNIGWIK